MRLGVTAAIAPASGAVDTADADEQAAYRAANARKAQFDHTYNAPDPRPFFLALRPVAYALPDHVAPAFRALIAALRERRGKAEVDLLDLGCSYGVNGALLRYGLSLEALYDRYGAEGLATLASAALRAQDVAWLQQHRAAPGLRITGLDAADQAVRYAQDIGLIDDGIVANLETDPPSPLPPLRSIDLLICTGCVGYVTHRTFERLLAALPGPPPWIACSVLRMFAYEEIAATLAAHGLATEMTVPTFAQRRFVSPEEQAHAEAQIRARGLDPAGRESNGWYHANLFVSRPPADIAHQPLSAILGCPTVRL